MLARQTLLQRKISDGQSSVKRKLVKKQQKKEMGLYTDAICDMKFLNQAIESWPNVLTNQTHLA